MKNVNEGVIYIALVNILYDGENCIM